MSAGSGAASSGREKRVEGRGRNPSSQPSVHTSSVHRFTSHSLEAAWCHGKTRSHPQGSTAATLIPVGSTFLTGDVGGRGIKAGAALRCGHCSSVKVTSLTALTCQHSTRPWSQGQDKTEILAGWVTDKWPAESSVLCPTLTSSTWLLHVEHMETGRKSKPLWSPHFHPKEITGYTLVGSSIRNKNTRLCQQEGCYNRRLRDQTLDSFLFFFFLTFIWLHQVLVVALRIFSGGMWDIVSWPGIEPRSPTLGAQSLNHWTTKEVLRLWILRPGFRYSLCYLFAVCLGKAPLTSPVPQSPHFQMRQTMAPAFSGCCKD